MNNRPLTNNKPKVNNTHSGIQQPIQLTQKKGNLWKWRYNGVQVRNHFASDFWYSQDGKNVFWGWQEQQHTLSNLKNVQILADATGRQYVEVKRNGSQTWKQYIDVAVCVCFHGRPSNPNDRLIHIDGDIHNCAADNLKWGE